MTPSRAKAGRSARRYYARAVMTAYGVITELAVNPRAQEAAYHTGEANAYPRIDRLPPEFKKISGSAAFLVVQAFSTTLPSTDLAPG